MQARVIPWPKANPPPLNDNGRWHWVLRWRHWVEDVLDRRYNSVMTNALAYTVHGRARAAVVLQLRLELARRGASAATQDVHTRIRDAAYAAAQSSAEQHASRLDDTKNLRPHPPHHSPRPPPPPPPPPPEAPPKHRPLPLPRPKPPPPHMSVSTPQPKPPSPPLHREARMQSTG